MFYQIQNLKTKKQLASATKSKIVKTILEAGWKIDDCKVVALDDALKNGFNIKTGNRNKRGRQFLGRSK